MSMTSREPAESALQPDEAPACHGPADFRQEMEELRRTATPRVWEGPRYRMTYYELGDGPPLIVARGIAGTFDGLALLFNRLKAQFRIVAYEYPGDVPDDGADLKRIRHEDLAADYLGLLDHLGIGRAYALGISFGSTVVLRALAEDSRRFPKAAVQGGFLKRRFTPVERLALTIGRRIPGRAERLPFREPILRWNNAPEFPAIIGDRLPILLDHDGETRIAALAHRVTLLTRLDLRPITPRIQTDVTGFHGREDRIVPVRELEELARFVPNFRAIELPTMGHQLQYTHGEMFARMITESFSGCSAAAGCSEAGAGEACSEASGPIGEAEAGCGGWKRREAESSCGGPDDKRASN